tara:strand:+ start:4783 stop:5460 length:678 start_codon:yes stop_codon:yes gene_type:complete
MKSKFSLIIDFDSTIISLETLECLAEIALFKNKNKNEIIDKISDYTKLAMNGDITFEESLDYRFNLIELSKHHIDKTIDLLKSKIDDSFISNIDFFSKHQNDIYIVSGGFYSIIDSVLLSETGIKWNIFANNLIFNDFDKVLGVDKKNPLSYSMGKVKLIQSLNLNNDIIMVGDGYTDYEVKKFNVANYFLAYTRHIQRDNVISKADFNCENFNQVIDFLEKNYS